MFNVEATSVCLSFFYLVSVTSLFVGFSWNLVLDLFTQVSKASVSFMKIGSVTVIFYLRECMNFYLFFQHVLTDLGKIIYSVSSHNGVALFWVLWKQVMWKPYVRVWCCGILQGCLKWQLQHSNSNNIYWA